MKAMCTIKVDGGNEMWIMLLSEEQIKVFEFLNRQGYDFEIEKGVTPIEL